MELVYIDATVVTVAKFRFVIGTSIKYGIVNEALLTKLEACIEILTVVVVINLLALYVWFTSTLAAGTKQPEKSTRAAG